MGRAPARGLADVVAASTALSEIDGQASRLWHRGYGINDLAKLGSFEEVAVLLQRGAMGAR
jgi:citrate synthase